MIVGKHLYCGGGVNMVSSNPECTRLLMRIPGWWKRALGRIEFKTRLSNAISLMVSDLLLRCGAPTHGPKSEGGFSDSVPSKLKLVLCE